MNIGSGPCDEAALRSRTPGQTASAGAWVLAASILGSSMAFIDSTAVNVALPALQSSLHASISEVQWVVESYTLFLGALLLTGGSLGDLFGQRNVFGVGIAIFAFASVWCGLAPDIRQLIFARAVQGVGGALLVPTSLALLSTSFSRKDVGRAIGTWSGFTSITSAVGPLLGGWLAQQASWRWVFFINAPLAVVVIGISLWHIPECGKSAERPRIDLLGAALATAGLGGIVFGFLQSSWTSGLAGVAALLGFVFAEARQKAPMLPLSIFRSWDFSGAGLLTLFLYGALSGALFFFPLNLVQVQGYSETAAGAALLPFILLVAGLSRWSARLLDRYSARTLLIVGPSIAAVGFVLFALPAVGGSYWITFFPPAMVLGLGMAVTVAPLTTTVMNSVETGRAGIASGINNALSRVAGLLSVAAFGVVLSFVYNQNLKSHLSVLDIDASQKLQIERMGLTSIGRRSDSTVQHAVNESFISGFRAVMWISAALAGMGALSSAALVGRRKASD